MKLALTLPGMNGTPIDSGLPGGAPAGGLFTVENGKEIIGGTGTDIIRTLIVLIIIIAIIFALWAVGKTGWDLITSRGHKEKLKVDADRIFYVVFGLILVFLSFVFLNVAHSIFGVDLLPFLVW